MSLKPSAQFRTWLDSWLEAGNPGDYLPPVPALVERWHISASTIKRILQEYQRQGRVVRISGKGSMIPLPASRGEKGDVPEKSSSWQSIVKAVLGSISRGEFRRGQSLPSIKLVSLQFKVSRATVIRAFKYLQKQKYIEKVGRRYWVGHMPDAISVGKARKIVFFLGRPGSFMNIFKRNRFGLESAFIKMENELTIHKYMLEYATLSDSDGYLSSWTANRNLPNGAVFYTTSAPFVPQARFNALVSALRRGKIPVLLTWPRPAREAPSGTTLFSHGNAYTQQIRQAVAYIIESGVSSVTLFQDTGPGQGTFYRLYPQLHNRAPDIRFRIIARTTPAWKGPEAFFQYLRETGVQYFLRKYSPISMETFQGLFHFTDDIYRGFELARDSEIWLMRTDSDAAAALEWAGRKHIRIPRELMILGFENNPQYYQYGISSCVSDLDQIGYMLAHALIRDMPIAKTSQGFIQTNALILHRKTTRMV